MQKNKLSWWQKLHWPEYAAEVLGTMFLIFVGLSAVTEKSLTVAAEHFLQPDRLCSGQLQIVRASPVV